MKKITMRLIFFAAYGAASFIGGWYLWQVPELIPCGKIVDIWPCSNMPNSVDMLIRLGLSVVGHDELANPDDMEVLAVLLYWLISTLVVAAVLLLLHRGFRRYRAKRRAAS